MALALAFDRDAPAFASALTPGDINLLSAVDTSGRRFSLYYDRLDRMVCGGRGLATPDAWGFFDPLLLDGSQPRSDFTSGVQTGLASSPNNVYAGQFDRVGASQKIFSTKFFNATTSIKFDEIDPTTFQYVVEDAFPNVGFQSQNGKTSTVDGFYQANTNSDFIFLDGVGKAYAIQCNVRFQGSTVNCLAEIDLVTGDAVPVDGIPARARTNPGPFEEPELFGETVEWRMLQFIPDPDSQFTRPKGRLLVMSRPPTFGTVANQTAWARFVEWNPTNLAGTPNRTHLRFELTTRLEYDETALRGGNGQTTQGFDLLFHPPQGRIVTWYTQNFQTPPGTANNTGTIGFTRQPVVASLGSSSEQSLARTGATVDFVAEVLGSLGEGVAGEKVEFSAARVSEAERFDGTTVGVGGTYNFLQAADAGSIQVFRDPDGAKVLLAETTDYTIVGGGTPTGITGVSPQWISGQTYLVTYTHLASELTPAHGEVLQPVASSGLDGQARSQIRWPDNADLEGALDVVTAEIP